MKQKIIATLTATMPKVVRDRVFNLGFNLSPEQFQLFSYQYGKAPHMTFGLRHLASRGFQPDSIIDVGAFHGDWSRIAREIWPNAHITMLEANEQKRGILSKTATDINADLHIALLGPEDGVKRAFHIMESGSSVFDENSPLSRETVAIPTRRLDSVLDSHMPDFLKLDVQGFELEVLLGAERCLKAAKGVLLEVSLLEINSGAPLMAEVVGFMAKRGFDVCDILEIHRRPLDGSTNQVDLFFVPKGSSLMSDTRHFA